jgi:hypothetical protein
MKEPRGETFELSSRGFHGAVDTIDDFFNGVNWVLGMLDVVGTPEHGTRC